MNKHLQSRRKIFEGKGGMGRGGGGRDKLYKGKIYKLEGTLQKYNPNGQNNTSDTQIKYQLHETVQKAHFGWTEQNRRYKGTKPIRANRTKCTTQIE